MMAWRAKRKEWTDANPEKSREYSRKWKEKNRDATLERGRLRRAADPEAARQRERDWYAKNAETVRARKRGESAAARRRDPDAARQRDREYWAEKRDVINSQRRARRDANLDAHNATAREWRRRTGRGRFYSQERRAIVLAAWIEEVSPTVVFDRDGWVCQHCGIECPRDAIWPAPNFATLDHVIPLEWGIFRGGFHSYANTQTLCHRCNSRKGNRYVTT